jgi:hypothetical protein
MMMMMMDFSGVVGRKRQRGSLYRHILSESKFGNFVGASARRRQKSKFGLGRRAVCRGFLEAHNPKSPKTGRGGVACGQGLTQTQTQMKKRRKNRFFRRM